MAVLGPVAGKLVDRIGARRMYRISTFASTLAVGAAAAAWGAGSLILFRVLGAVAGASTGPAALAIINSRFPPERRAQAMGYWSLVVAGAPVFGVIIGGPLVDGFGWRWIFIIQFPLAALSYVLGTLVLPETELGEQGPVRHRRGGHPRVRGGIAARGAEPRPRDRVGDPRGRRRLPAVPAASSPRSSSNERRIGLPAAAARLLPPAQLHLPDDPAVLRPVRLHGRLHPHPAAAVGGPRLLRPPRSGWCPSPARRCSRSIGPVAGYFAVKLGERTIGAAGSVGADPVHVRAGHGRGRAPASACILVGLALSGMAMGTRLAADDRLHRQRGRRARPRRRRAPRR